MNSIVNNTENNSDLVHGKCTTSVSFVLGGTLVLRGLLYFIFRDFLRIVDHGVGSLLGASGLFTVNIAAFFFPCLFVFSFSLLAFELP